MIDQINQLTLSAIRWKKDLFFAKSFTFIIFDFILVRPRKLYSLIDLNWIYHKWTQID